MKRFNDRLDFHSEIIKSDPQANPVKLLAYDISKYVETRELAFRDIESVVKTIADEQAIARAERLRSRAGVTRISSMQKSIAAAAQTEAKKGFKSFAKWSETAAQGIVLTAHPTFSTFPHIYETLGSIASKGEKRSEKEIKHLKTLPYVQKTPPTLQQEHAQTQATLARIQSAIDGINRQILQVAQHAFPKQWTALNIRLLNVYSWVGYDIDGRTDISWADALRLRLSEKLDQLSTYEKLAGKISKKHGLGEKLQTRLQDAITSTGKDLVLFEKDLTDKENLIEAANHLTRSSKRRLRNTKALYKLINADIKAAQSDEARMELLLLRSRIRCFGLGTARIHFRVNARHVMEGIRGEFGISDGAVDTRTLVQRAAEKTSGVKTKAVNFASLAMETNTAHRQMILTAQIHKYIDNETPIRLLIAETEDSLIPLGMLYLAKLYGLENHLDISPLFETAAALNNGGRIIGKMLGHDVYRNYVKKRGVMAIQTGFSDAGRFMGQVPATLAIERLQSHFAMELAKKKLKNVSAIIFNTHGESLGRGGHHGALSNRLDYVMSPWAKLQFEKRGLHLCHETSFQGGDGFLWFQTDKLAQASVTSILLSRLSDCAEAENDTFYTERDFSWDLFRTMSSEQAQLYANPDYVSLLGVFGQSLLVPTGSRATKRAAGGSTAFNPRTVRAIPHNAILQQFGIPANIYYGTGKIASIDPDALNALLKSSPRAKHVFGLARKALLRSNSYVLTAYGRLFDPGFWIGRQLSEQEPYLAESCRMIANSLIHNESRSRMVNLANFLRLDFLNISGINSGQVEYDKPVVILHALRLAVIMKMTLLATQLPQYGQPGTSGIDILKDLQNLQAGPAVERLKAAYPQKGEDMSWTDQLTEKSQEGGHTKSYPHLVSSIIKPLERANELIKQITVAVTHRYDAYG